MVRASPSGLFHRNVLARLAVLAPFALLAACNGRDDGPLDIAIIDQSAALHVDGIRLSPGAQHLRGATAAGLVSLDERGEVIPALADRWIVTEDGLSFIFRLRDGTWANGRPIDAESARRELRAAIRALKGTSLGLDLAAIAEVRAMAGRVVEIRLSTPVPLLMQLLAQPELALGPPGPVDGVAPNGGMGPMLLARDGDITVLSMKSPGDRGEPETEDWQAHVRPLRLRPASAGQAVTMFNDGQVDLVLGGRLGNLPLVSTGPLSRGTVRVDQVLGLFGLRVMRPRGFLASRENREALALALDRQGLMSAFNLGGWVSTTRIAAAGLPDDPGLMAERWAGVSLEDRRAAAAVRVAAWRTLGDGVGPVLTIAIGTSRGERLLLDALAAQLGTVGIRLEAVAEGAQADLSIMDQPARYAGVQWFLNQFNCSLRRGMCDSGADALVRQALETPDTQGRAGLIGRAESMLTQANVYIPIGAPVRFSLVRGNVAGFAPNSWAYHPLPPLAVIPN